MVQPVQQSGDKLGDIGDKEETDEAYTDVCNQKNPLPARKACAMEGADPDVVEWMNRFKKVAR